MRFMAQFRQIPPDLVTEVCLSASGIGLFDSGWDQRHFAGPTIKPRCLRMGGRRSKRASPARPQPLATLATSHLLVRLIPYIQHVTNGVTCELIRIGKSFRSHFI